MINKIREILQSESEAIFNIPLDNPYDDIVNLIHKRVHEQGGKLICSGMGKAGQIALNMATTFSSTGTCAVYLHPSEAQHGDLGILRSNDVLLLISNSGKTREIVELITLAKNLHPEIPIICITGQFMSPLAINSDLMIYTGKTEEVCPLGLTPTVSTTVMTVIGDILVVLLMEKIGFTKEQYSLRHHSGYLGEKSRQGN
jgi:arabinose-5-phosphate isomerase